mgnify:CR=1 FL=1
MSASAQYAYSSYRKVYFIEAIRVLWDAGMLECCIDYTVQ